MLFFTRGTQTTKALKKIPNKAIGKLLTPLGTLGVDRIQQVAKHSQPAIRSPRRTLPISLLVGLVAVFSLGTTRWHPKGTKAQYVPVSWLCFFLYFVVWRGILLSVWLHRNARSILRCVAFSVITNFPLSTLAPRYAATVDVDTEEVGSARSFERCWCYTTCNIRHPLVYITAYIRLQLT